MREKLKRLALPIAAAILALLCLSCLLVYSHLANMLDSQHQAERWQGEGELKFSQLSCFMSVDRKLTLEQVYTFRNAMMTKFHEAALDIDNDSQLFCDAWSTTGKVYVSSDQGKGDVSVIAVGGNFFDFHPIRLLSGNYISPDDLMKDRVLLDEETAWLLFGGTQLEGMSFKIDGVPFVVAGVIEREQDFASLKAYTSGMGIYMSYDAYSSIKSSGSSTLTATASSDSGSSSSGSGGSGGSGSGSSGDNSGSSGGSSGGSGSSGSSVGIECYEVVMAEPVKGFALGVAKEKFPIGGGVIVDNSNRYSFENVLKLVKQFGARSMQTHGVILPYWENAARCIEDWCLALLIAAMVTAVLPLVLLAIFLVRLFIRGKGKLTQDLMPRAKERVGEAIRVRQRKAWERRYGKKEENGGSPT
mgnify:FL=1